MKVFKNGLMTGMLLQLAIGPVFFFIVNLALQRTIMDGFAGAIAVTLADYVYIALAILGVGKLLENQKVKKYFGIISSVVLILFGLYMLKGVFNQSVSKEIVINSASVLSSFLSVFALTITSPLTIVMWTSLFAAKTIEYNYTKRELIIFGLSTGLATLIFMGSSVILFSLIKGSVPVLLIQILNAAVGLLLVGYGGMRLMKIIKGKN